jgi:hypothetical protein
MRNPSPTPPVSPDARRRARKWLRELLRDGERLSLPLARRPAAAAPRSKTQEPTRGKGVGE